MKLEQQFKQWLDTNPRKEIRDVELVNIANNYAIGFAEWKGKLQPSKNPNCFNFNRIWSIKPNSELLEIYNQQNNLKQ